MNVLLHPLPVSVFMEQYWEQKPLLIKRDDPHFYSQLFSRKELESWFVQKSSASAPRGRSQKTAAHDPLRELNDSVSIPPPPSSPTPPPQPLLLNPPPPLPRAACVKVL